jgi:hypothetical protein
MFKKSLSVLGLSLLLAAHVSFAGPTLVKFKGSFVGTFSATVTGGLMPYGGGGPGKAVFASKTGGTTGSLKVSASDATYPGVTYSTELDFKAHGKCTAKSVVPGYSDAAGSGTWKLKGGKISYQITGSDSSGSYTVNGTVKAQGKKLSLVGNFTIVSQIPGAPTGGSYSFK